MDYSDELIISYFFPPSNNISGIVLAKRIINNNKKVDVLTTNQDNSLEDFSEILDDFIKNKIFVDVSYPKDSPDGIFEFIDNSLEVLSPDYKSVTSRSWLMSNHFLACAYKFHHPEVFWRAEFSDPLLHDIKNTINLKDKHKIDNVDFFNRINEKIIDYPKLENRSSTFFTVEYLTFLFADEIIFTNVNQRDMMIEQFPIDLKNLIMEKSTISPHPTLPDKYYELAPTDFRLNPNCINIAYFGNFYYPQRNFDTLFEAFGNLDSDKIRLYIFISNRKALDVDIKNIYLKRPLDYLEFLNACRKFDVLLVNDVETKEYWPKNPYLPSKLSDYLGSGSDIWAIAEKGSVLDGIPVKYKSYVDDYDSNADVLNQILDDNADSSVKRLFRRLKR